MGIRKFKFVAKTQLFYLPEPKEQNLQKMKSSERSKFKVNKNCIFHMFIVKDHGLFLHNFSHIIKNADFIILIILQHDIIENVFLFLTLNPASLKPATHFILPISLQPDNLYLKLIDYLI